MEYFLHIYFLLFVIFCFASVLCRLNYLYINFVLSLPASITYRVVHVTPNDDGQPQLISGISSNQVQFYTCSLVCKLQCILISIVVYAALILKVDLMCFCNSFARVEDIEVVASLWSLAQNENFLIKLQTFLR